MIFVVLISSIFIFRIKHKKTKKSIIKRSKYNTKNETFIFFLLLVLLLLLLTKSTSKITMILNFKNKKIKKLIHCFYIFTIFLFLHSPSIILPNILISKYLLFFVV